MKVPAGVMQIIQTLRQAGRKALLAGGCVRDHLLGHTPEDWDIATDAPPEEVVRLFERTAAVGAQFGVVKVLIGEEGYEVARFRKEGPYLDGRHPQSVAPADPREDALRRDFTVNGMFYDPVAGEVVDYVGGQDDLSAKLIRAIGDPEERFEEDHLRLLRAVRFSARLDFGIAPETMSAIKKLARRIEKTSAERIRDELTAMWTGPRADRAAQLLLDTGLLEAVLPEVAAMDGVAQPPEFHPEGDVWTHTKHMLAMLDMPAPTLAWGVLLHDVGKPGTYKVSDRIRFNGHAKEGVKIAENICKRLRMPNQHTTRIIDLVKHHMRFMQVREMRESRRKRFLREPFFPELLELHRIDCMACGARLRNYEFCKAELKKNSEAELHPPPLLNGHALIEMGFSPGPRFQEVLSALEDEQLEGRITTVEEARNFLIARMSDADAPL